MLVENKTVAIVGGGMGGLTLARLLQMKNVNVKIYERDLNRNVRVQGSTLDLHVGSGLEAIARAGLTDEFYRYYRPIASKMRIVDQSLNIRFDDHDSENNIAEQRPEIDRSPLRDLLLNSLKPNTVVWDSHFSAMERQSDGWLLHFKNGTSAYADLVIAADGANSKVRPYLSAEAPVYAGVTLIEGNIYHAEKNVPRLSGFTKGGKVMAFGNERFIGYGTKGDGSMMFVASFKAPEHPALNIDFKDKAQVFAWFKATFSGWAEEWHEFFTNDEVHFILRPQYYFPLDQNWETQENLTMIGDAAHCMPPFAGEGANVAMQDAFELAECLTSNKFITIKAAISHFEKQMVKRAAAATRDTLENTEIMHSRTALEQMLAFFSRESFPAS
ncbi:FAD-dependent oxidoreductase [Pedobacter africanus]|uniref:Flavin-dependent monooxygenase n=1 Tax=Pedobacter africanus TaxID=151894 RepID=A0A1W2DHB1_9SPHI|nr:NAD(P)/FAD-dependent oxidoreductase [Pedobacter africanus]SMC96877.1 2-polyprenyl-6-methoxyphenol hydroxylase [Pedobacter africanus]